MNKHVDSAVISRYLQQLQDCICNTFTDEDGHGTFHEDQWSYHKKGGGKTRILEKGRLIEKGGVNFSHIQGDSLPPAATLQRPQLAGMSFEALGLSLVIHPYNPYVPTVHANLRFIKCHKPDDVPVWWFGGGYDLTPFYGFEEDCCHWHRTAYQACSSFGAQVYPQYKKWCDDYFYLKHRKENRGVGGLFFDDLNWGYPRSFDFMQAIGNSFLKGYLPIFKKRNQHPFGDNEKHFQWYRRGRYVEFNLLYDRGTIFGLQSGGRVESILMSLPPQVSWSYNKEHFQDAEKRLKENFLRPRDWLHQQDKAS